MHEQFSNILPVATEALPKITENTATLSLLSEAQRQDDDDRDPFARDCCITYFHHVYPAAQVKGIIAALI